MRYTKSDKFKNALDIYYKFLEEQKQLLKNGSISKPEYDKRIKAKAAQLDL